MATSPSDDPAQMVQTAVFPDSATLAAQAAARTVAVLAQAQAQRGRASLIVTGGSILEQTLGQLKAAAKDAALDWRYVDIWWGDERFVPVDSPDRNDLQTWEAGLQSLDLDLARIHHMPALRAGNWHDDVDAAAAAYAAELAVAALHDPGAAPDLPQLDVALLGVGPDGHCASLFPGHPALDEQSLSVVGVRDSPKPPPARTSLTFRTLNSVDHVWFVASSAGKAEAVARALGEGTAHDTPSSAPRGRVDTLWLLDAAAAAGLPS